MTKHAVSILFVAVASSACSKKGDTPPSPGEPPPTVASAATASSVPVVDHDVPSTGKVRGTIGTTRVELANVSARLVEKGLELDFSSEEVPPSDYSYSLEPVIPPGPGGKFFVGSTIFVATQTSTWNKAPSKLPFLEAPFVEIRLDQVEPRKDGRVRGTIRVKSPAGPVYVGGSFDAKIQSDQIDRKWLMRQPAAASTKPAAGRVEGKPVTYQSAIAFVLPTEGVRNLQDIQLYPEPGVTCANRRPAPHSLSIKVGVLVDSASPSGPHAAKAEVGYSSEKDGKFTIGFRLPDTNAWLELDRVDLATAARVRGRIHVDSVPGDEKPITASGSFDAEICRAL